MPRIKHHAATQLYCTFWLGEQCFGIPADSVSEVHAPAPITRILGAPNSVRGYVNLRGQLFLVVDPGELLLGDWQAPAAEQELIVFTAAIGESLAIAVDRVGDMLDIRDDQIHRPKARSGNVDLPGGLYRAEQLTSGHAALEGLLVNLVEPQRLLAVSFASSIET